ncbi:MAG: hypothetical protein P4L40_02550, partial [Terracidiphilus sp.]|nr:hypothetical protein [Terracidiphilus sp.]
MRVYLRALYVCISLCVCVCLCVPECVCVCLGVHGCCAEGVRPMPYLDVPVRTALELPGPGQYKTRGVAGTKGPKWSNAHTAGTLEGIVY